MFFGALWLLISGSVVWYNLALAATIGLLGSYLSAAIMSVSFGKNDSPTLTGSSGTPLPVRLFYAAVFVPVFALEIMISAATVSLFVLRPDNIFPGLLRYELKLRNSLAITILANLITLTPGTMTMACEYGDNLLFIHSLSARTEEDREKTLKGARRLEKWVGRILE